MRKIEISELNDEALLWVFNHKDKFDLNSIREVTQELDNRGVEHKKIDSNKIRLTTAEKATPHSIFRLLGFIVDIAVIGYFYYFTYYLTRPNPSFEGDCLAFAFYLYLYYTFFEAVFNRTIGKLIFGLKVVDIDGDNPSFGKISKRSLCRLIPYEQISFIFNQWIVGPRMKGHWHDNISETYVVSVKKLKE